MSASGDIENAILAARMRLLERLHRGLAHDLRGPLNAVGLNLDLLGVSLGESADERQRKYLQALRRGVSDLTSGLERIMGLFRSWDDGDAFDVCDPLREIVELLTRTARGRGVELVLEPATTRPRVRRGRHAMRYVCLELTWLALHGIAEESRLTLAAKAGHETVDVHWSVSGGPPAAANLSQSIVAAAPTPLTVVESVVRSFEGRVRVDQGGGRLLTLTVPRADEPTSG